MLTSPPGPQDEAKYAEAAELLKSLGHPLRLKIVCGLLAGSCTQTRIASCLGIPQSSIAQHLAVLRRAGTVEGRRAGNEVLLSVADARVAEILRLLCAGAPPCVDFSGGER